MVTTSQSTTDFAVFRVTSYKRRANDSLQPFPLNTDTYKVTILARLCLVCMEREGTWWFSAGWLIGWYLKTEKQLIRWQKRKEGSSTSKIQLVFGKNPKADMIGEKSGNYKYLFFYKTLTLPFFMIFLTLKKYYLLVLPFAFTILFEIFVSEPCCPVECYRVQCKKLLQIVIGIYCTGDFTWWNDATLLSPPITARYLKAKFIYVTAPATKLKTWHG